MVPINMKNALFQTNLKHNLIIYFIILFLITKNLLEFKYDL